MTLCYRMSNCVSWFQSHYNETHLVLQLCWKLSKRHLINVSLLRCATATVLKAEVFHSPHNRQKGKQLQYVLSLIYAKPSLLGLIFPKHHCFPWKKISLNWDKEEGSGNSPSVVSTKSQMSPIYKLIFCFHSLISLSYFFPPLLALSPRRDSVSFLFNNSLG